MATTLFSGALRPFPGFSSHWGAEQRRAAEGILADVCVALGGAHLEPTMGADIEDFWEDACRLSAAWTAANCDLAIVPQKTTWTEDELAERMGPVSRAEQGGNHARDSLVMHPTLMEHGGRDRAMTLVTFEPEPEQVRAGAVDLVGWMVERARAGVSRVVIKSTEHKGGIWAVPTSTDFDTCGRAVVDALDWSAIRLEARRDAFVVQDWIDMRWEYRCFVIDGEVLTAAGCIEEFTPIDYITTEGRFQTLLREHRGHHGGRPSPVVYRPEIAERLLAFARDVASEHGGTVVIDVAIDHSRDECVVVELNELPNSGLYASNPWLVAEALATAKDRGYSAVVMS